VLARLADRVTDLPRGPPQAGSFPHPGSKMSGAIPLAPLFLCVRARFVTRRVLELGSFLDAVSVTGRIPMGKGFGGKTARVWQQGKGGMLHTNGVALVLFPVGEGETDHSPAGYLTDIRTALIDDNNGHVNVVVCESDYRALKRGVEHLGSEVQ
jgi:hypothetical protein